MMGISYQKKRQTPKRQAGRSNRPGNAKTADFPRIFGGSFFSFRRHRIDGP